MNVRNTLNRSAWLAPITVASPPLAARAILLRLFIVFWWIVVLSPLAATGWRLSDQWDGHYWRVEFYIEHSLLGRPIVYGPPLTLGMSPKDAQEFQTAITTLGEAQEAEFEQLIAFTWRYLLLCPVPYVVMTITRWILTGCWRLGPRW